MTHCVSIFVFGLLVLALTSAPVRGLTCSARVSYSHRTRCGRISIFRCRTTSRKLTYYCCAGWTGAGCAYAICVGKTNPQACKSSGWVKEGPSGPTHTNGGGTCSSPNVCTGCNNGFYSSGGYCKPCSRISHCYYPKCTNAHNSICHYCEGVVKNYQSQYGWWAYTRWRDGGRSCQRACSWRTGSRCYPGNCPQTTAASCKCSTGFSGTDCRSMTEYPTIVHSSISLRSVGGTSANSNSTQPRIYTSILNVADAYVQMGGQYVKPLPAAPSYINKASSHIGITTGGVSLQLVRGGTSHHTFRSQCSLNVPKASNYNCQGNFTVRDEWPTFHHADRLIVSAFAINGGYITVIDRERSNNQGTYSMHGKTTTQTYEIQIDLEGPTHCTATDTCMADMLDVPDGTLNHEITIHWKNWTDVDAGLKSFSMEWFDLRHAGAASDAELVQGNRLYEGHYGNNVAQAKVTFPSPGPYAILLTAVDNVGNQRTARRITIYDNEAVVELQDTHDQNPTDDSCIVSNSPASVYIVNADPATHCQWITSAPTSVEVAWRQRFINRRHLSKRWLNAVSDVDYVSNAYDDLHGYRQNSETTNVLGIVRFKVSYNITYEGKITTFPFTETPNVLSESAIVTVAMVDGIGLTIVVRGYDIAGANADDVISIKADNSPPVVTNLYLTRAGKEGLIAHYTTALEKLTIEWVVYDHHSGIHSVLWRLYSNTTEETVQHGMAKESPQAIAQCQNATDDSCYCSPFDGCFNQHYRVKPLLTETGGSGLERGKHIAVQDGDYYIDVVVTNRAQLTTTATLKITVDVTPPEAGSVLEGVAGGLEIDYQQSKRIHVHWKDFFDRESGILFYRYGYGAECLSDDQFNIEESNELRETVLEHAAFTVPAEGTFYITVAAYNKALVHSKPVCSDGVTVDSSVHGVKEVIVKGTRMRPSLVIRSDASVWYISTDRTIQLIENPSDACRAAGRNISEDQFIAYPRRNSTLDDTSRELCTNMKTADAELLSVVTSTKYMEILWKADSDRSKIYDFHVALSSSQSNEPDITWFESSNSHQFFMYGRIAIGNGRIFNIIFKTVSKSGKINFQSIGPFLVDDSSPVFQGEILLTYSGDVGRKSNLIIKWNSGAFLDNEGPLTFELAIGTSKNGVDIYPFSPISNGRGCNITEKYQCTTLSMSELHRSLHDKRPYYATLKATNAGGLFVIASSRASIHSVTPLVTGAVVDIDSNPETSTMDDIDFQTSTSTMSARWYGFGTSHEVQQYTVCAVEEENTIVGKCANVGTATEATLTGLQLDYFKKYRFSVSAVTSSGNVTRVSDGVTPINTSKTLDEMLVYGGKPCNVQCGENITYQSPLNTISVYWTVPSEYKTYISIVHWHLQEHLRATDSWKNVTESDHASSVAGRVSIVHPLQSGYFYRFIMKFCVDGLCFPDLYSNRIAVISKPPVYGTMSVQYSNTSYEIQVAFDQFKDEDMESDIEAKASIDHYEWALTDDSHSGRIVTTWTVANVETEYRPGKVGFTIPLRKAMRFTKCWRVSVRGFSKTGLYSTVSADVIPCRDALQVRAPLVIDAVKTSSQNKDGNVTIIGKPITFDEHEDTWEEADKDYTPSPNILSAVWPSLRYPVYNWAVLELHKYDPIYYDEISKQDIQTLCASQVAVTCGKTDQLYINAEFRAGKLINGKRYVVCIHSQSTVLNRENNTEDLPELTACSDGVTVDVSPPVAGEVWISEKGVDYQSFVSELRVYWEAFTDVETLHHSAHATGIKNYEVGIGSQPGGADDIFPFTDVGVTNQYTVHGPVLKNGSEYFASVIGVDFTGRRTLSVSPPIVIDSTAPITYDVPVRFQSSNATNGTKYTVCWPGLFQDAESGMSFYIWGIGSVPGVDDIYPTTKTSEECGRISDSQDVTFSDGREYIVSIVGYNRVGMSTHNVSTTRLVDKTPPKIGRVLDGIRGQDEEVDYVTATHEIDAFWIDFHDEESVIQHYYVTVHTKDWSFEVVQKFSVGTAEEVHLQLLHLSEGITYHVTVTACNMADLCSSATSDGVTVDSSVPVPGTVTDGYQTTDSQYQRSRSTIVARWSGFVDNQSQISHYTWRVGTARGDDDIVPSRPVHGDTVGIVADMGASYGRTLPVKTRLFSTVRAYNMAGLWSEASSNGVIVDDTDPTIISSPRHVQIGSLVTSTICVTSALTLKWDVEDKESHIKHQYISIVSSLSENLNISLKIPGIHREFTFTDLTLHDGSEYDVYVSVCNGANTCVKSVIENILVDSTPPTAGTFAIDTNSAAALARQPDYWMVWNPESLKLAWLGFSDEHSGVSKYMLNVGSQYMTANLNKIPGVPVVVDHDDNTGHSTDEGDIQTYTVPTQNLSSYESVYISMWAENGVGLQSDITLSQFRLKAGGEMELVRTCPASCLGYCMCTAKGTKCRLSATSEPCQNVLGDASYAAVTVLDNVVNEGDPNNTDVTHTPLRSLLSATWVVQGENGIHPKWFDWSIGLTPYSSPYGVFGASTEVWHDAGVSKSVNIPLDNEHQLEDGKRYSVFIRAWYDSTRYADYKSPGVIMMSKPPRSRIRHGATLVMEITNQSSSDVDYVRRASDVSIDWSYVFDSDTLDDTFTYWIYLSTIPGGDDILVNDNPMYSPASRIQLPTDILTRIVPGVLYYANVQATNAVGLQTIATSDGFTVDIDPPTKGHVMDGADNYDLRYQNDRSSVFANWHAFKDKHSGVRSYHWCVSSTGSPGSCDILPKRNVGMETSVKKRLNIPLQNGQNITSEVYAADGVGLVSQVATSNGVMIDTTPPSRYSFGNDGQNLVQNPSFENPSDFEKLTSFIVPTTCIGRYDDAWHLNGWIPSNCVRVLKTDILSQSAFLWFRGSLSQTISGLQIGQMYKVSIYSNTLLTPANPRKYTLGTIRMAGINNIMKVIPNPEFDRDDDISWQLFTYFFKATNESDQLTIETLGDPYGMLVDYVSVCEVTTVASNSMLNVKVTTRIADGDTVVQAVWAFEDKESGIKDYRWAIGTFNNDTRFQGYQRVDGPMCSATATLHTPDVASNIVVTVVATNGAGSNTVGYSAIQSPPDSSNYGAVYGATSGVIVVVLLGGVLGGLYFRKRRQASSNIRGAMKENKNYHTKKPSFVKFNAGLATKGLTYDGLEHAETPEERYERLKRESAASAQVTIGNPTYEEVTLRVSQGGDILKPVIGEVILQGNPIYGEALGDSEYSPYMISEDSDSEGEVYRGSVTSTESNGMQENETSTKNNGMQEHEMSTESNGMQENEMSTESNGMQENEASIKNNDGQEKGMSNEKNDLQEHEAPSNPEEPNTHNIVGDTSSMSVAETVKCDVPEAGNIKDKDDDSGDNVEMLHRDTVQLEQTCDPNYDDEQPYENTCIRIETF